MFFNPENRTSKIRAGLASLMLVLFVQGCSRGDQDDLKAKDWKTFSTRFISEDGRVIDTGNNDISHSEGQGYGMLLAVAYDDRQTFDKIWDWTREHLQIRDDRLFCWRWEPDGSVTDRNNASDGDVLIAWALFRATKTWRERSYRRQAKEIMADIRGKLLQRTPHGLLLLPGAEGFVTPEGTTVNLSYWVFPALEEFKRFDDRATWVDVIQTGYGLLQVGRFGRWNLPPDWLYLGQKPEPAKSFDPYFGYNAIRIPLYLCWTDKADFTLMQPFSKLWQGFEQDQIPAFVNLQDDSLSEYALSLGMLSVSSVTLNPPNTKSAVPLPGIQDGDDYYSACLLLLTKLAVFERKNRQ